MGASLFASTLESLKQSVFLEEATGEQFAKELQRRMEMGQVIVGTTKQREFSWMEFKAYGVSDEYADPNDGKPKIIIEFNWTEVGEDEQEAAV